MLFLNTLTIRLLNIRNVDSITYNGRCIGLKLTDRYGRKKQNERDT